MNDNRKHGINWINIKRYTFTYFSFFIYYIYAI